MSHTASWDCSPPSLAFPPAPAKPEGRGASEQKPISWVELAMCIGYRTLLSPTLLSCEEIIQESPFPYSRTPTLLRTHTHTLLSSCEEGLLEGSRLVHAWPILRRTGSMSSGQWTLKEPSRRPATRAPQCRPRKGFCKCFDRGGVRPRWTCQDTNQSEGRSEVDIL